MSRRWISAALLLMICHAAAAEALNVSASRTMLDVIDLQRRWSADAVDQYRRAARLAREKK